MRARVIVDPGLLNQLEDAIRARNPILADSLQPGLREPEIRRILDKANAIGDVAGLATLYTWHNGTSEEGPHTPWNSAFFPGTSYRFLPLEVAADHFAALGAAATEIARLTQDPTNIAERAGRYFPVFWDGATGYLGVDLKPSQGSGIAIIEFESEDPFHRAYATFDEFIVDTLRANKGDGALECFRPG